MARGLRLTTYFQRACRIQHQEGALPIPPCEVRGNFYFTAMLRTRPTLVLLVTECKHASIHVMSMYERGHRSAEQKHALPGRAWNPHI